MALDLRTNKWNFTKFCIYALTRFRLGLLASIFANRYKMMNIQVLFLYNDLHVILMYLLAFSHPLLHANLLSNIAAR